MAKGRIAFAVGTIDGGGIGRVVITLAREFIDMGYAVDILLTHPPKDRALPPGARPVFLAPRGRGAIWPARRYLRREQPEMVICARDNMGIAMTLAHRLSGIGARCQLVWTLHTNIAADQAAAPFAKRLAGHMARPLIRHADRIVAVSQGLAGEARKLGLRAVEVIENPVWERPYDSRETAGPHPWLQDGQGPVILGAGRLVPQKDFETLLQAVASLRTAVPARLIILGDGPERGRLAQRAAELGIADHVDMIGHVNDPMPYMARADLFVLSSRYEGAGLVLAEALGLGCPVVATDCAYGPAEILEGGALGLLAPVGDARALANAIRATLGSRVAPDIAASVRERFSARRAAQAYLNRPDQAAA